jgi:hypothetical protein
LIKQYTENQLREVNQLYELRKILEAGTAQEIILPITGATFGVAPTATKRVTITEAGVTEPDVKRAVPITSGKYRGYQYLIVQKNKPGDVVAEQELLISYSSITPEIAEKIATVLTTKALLRGRELTPDERKAYFQPLSKRPVHLFSQRAFQPYLPHCRRAGEDWFLHRRWERDSEGNFGSRRDIWRAFHYW